MMGWVSLEAAIGLWEIHFFFHISKREKLHSSVLSPTGDHTEFVRFVQQAPLSADILPVPDCF